MDSSLRIPIGLMVLLLTFGAGLARADVITHFGDGPFPDVTVLLNGEGMNNPAFETTALAFMVPGTTGDVDLTFTFLRDTGAFLFNFGFFDVSTVTANPVTETQLYATQALGAATLVFDDASVNPGATAMATVAAGTPLGFFLVPNNTLAAFNANPGDFYPSQTSNNALRSPLFSVTDANPGQLDQMLSFVGNGKTLFTFEDLTRTGVSDQDFTDLAFLIDAELPPQTVIPEPGTLALFGLGLLGLGLVRRRKKR